MKLLTTNIILFINLFLINIFCTNTDTEKYISSSIKKTFVKDSLENESQVTLTIGQEKILKGAKQNLADETEYDLTMGYYVLNYQEGELTGKKVYPNGDLDPSIGVCTDVIIRSLRYAGIVDLQEAIQTDLHLNQNKYPMSRWGNKKPDSNIDHRRVMNLEVWFANYWNTGDGENFEPGDIVVWDMNEDGASDHIGIVSDKKEGESYFVIHNHPDPGYIAEEDKLFNWKISGHFRIKE
jgi:uncharacterized protein YijF (DUF1287 family)